MADDGHRQLSDDDYLTHPRWHEVTHAAAGTHHLMTGETPPWLTVAAATMILTADTLHGEREPGEPDVDTPNERAFQALLAEYSGLLQLIDRKATVIATLVTFHITAVATIVGLLVARKGDVRLLVLVPLISSTLGLLVASQDRDARMAESYVETTLRPLVEEASGESRLWRWSEHLVHGRDAVVVAITRAVPLGVLFPGLAILSLVATVPHMRSWLDWMGWSVGLLLTILLIVGWLEHGALLARRLLSLLRRTG
ncbi:hypothetical protein ACGFI5_06720 [Micromonospora tulbaghiae]|uniref:Uncharacterized protein n=1 Tax=Micromonospora tulbaghiae TaxID=479978 RepID=A0ABY0KVZ0_9ACTN|nr:hypothetical protein [Micromonospora tulbaghiae]MDX5459555.1 hypothetical protein [Micromonospora tulbaghiae]SCF15595.1 hypothetical protein GA0070562_0713 [Micromonospora tulbaghiae]